MCRWTRALRNSRSFPAIVHCSERKISLNAHAVDMGTKAALVAVTFTSCLFLPCLSAPSCTFDLESWAVEASVVQNCFGLSGHTPLTAAVALNQVGRLSRLLRLGDAVDVNMLDGRGRAALHEAAARGRTMATRALLDRRDLDLDRRSV